MNRLRAAPRFAAALTATLLLGCAMAQSQGKGRGGMYAPVPSPVLTADPTRHEPPPRPSDFLGYMTAECASMHDGLRTASGRARYAKSQSELRVEYQRRCRAEEFQARRRWAQEQWGARSRIADQEYRAREEAERQQAEQQQSMEQCLEMRRIISGKNARLDRLTPGEVADLRRFEGNFATRCPMLAR